MPVYYPTETVSRYIYFKDKDGTAVNPATKTCTIKDPSGATKATPTLAEIETGKWEMNYNLPADATRGDWTIEIEATIGTYKGIKKFYFEVEYK